MDAKSEEELCAFLSEVTLDQFERVIMEEGVGDLILNHVMHCPKQSCARAIEEFNKAVDEGIAKEEAAMTSDEKWKRDLLERRILTELRNKGIIE